MRVVLHNGHIKDGKLIVHYRGLFNESIMLLGDKQVTIEVKVKRKQRSNQQNAYYWGVIIMMMQEAVLKAWGEYKDKNQCHEILKRECNYDEKVNEDTGEIIKVAKSTTQNTTVDQEEFHEKCREFLLEWFNIIVPLPGEELEIDF